MKLGDIDGRGRLDVVTMSDRNTLRWYHVPADPRQPWARHDIGRPVHACAAIGDIDGDGDLDVVGTDVWFENVRGDGTEWVEHFIGPNTSPPADFRPDFAFNATAALVCDLGGDGDWDVFSCDMEGVPGERPPRYYISENVSER